MKKILIFSLAYYPKYVGGAEVAIKEITDRIPESDMQFDMLTLRFDSLLPKEERVGNVSVYRLGFATRDASIRDLSRFPLVLNKYLFPFLAAWKAWRLEREEQYDLTWVMMANYGGFGALFFKMMCPRIPLILTLQEGDPLAHIHKRVGFLRPVFQQIFLRADRIQAISTFLAEWAKAMGHPKDVLVIPNAVDTARFRSPCDPTQVAQLKERLGKQEADVWLITTSRLVAKNAVDVVIRTLPLLPAHIKFLVLGVGPDEAMLRALATQLGVIDRIHFLGHIPHDMLPLYLQASDVFIRPSRSEGMGNSFIEAMAAGIPVIATRVGGIPDFLVDPKDSPEHPTGLTVAVNDPNDTARAVITLVSDMDLRNRCVREAQRMVESRYDWGRVAPLMRANVFESPFSS